MATDNMRPNGTTLECSLCFDEQEATPDNHVFFANKSDRDDAQPCCVTCFKERIVDEFWRSIRNPTAFPFRWGDMPVRFQDYANFIPDYESMLAEYEARKEELEMPAEKRLYCPQDGAFLGDKRAADHPGRQMVQCACGEVVCRKCTKQGMPSHVCRRDSEDAFDGLVRGRDFQTCPRCNAPQYLGDDCNSVNCRNCRQPFCFICRHAVEHRDKAHWQRGGCPRFNQPEDENCLYDDQVNVIDDEEDPAPAAVDAAAMAPAEAAPPGPAAAPEAPPGDPTWWPLFRERIPAARAILNNLRDNIVQAVQPPNPLPQQHRDTLSLIRDLHRNYELFNFDDSGHLDPDVAVNDEDHVRDIVTRHEHILNFGNSRSSPWAWRENEGLRTLWMWYFNHVKIRWEGGAILMRYGDPHVEDAMAGEWA